MVENIPDELAELAFPVDQLQTYADNPREGDIGALCTSLETNGQYRPIVVNRRDNTILAGNHTYMAACHLGWDRIAVTWVDADDEQARRIVLVDNRSNDIAAYDDAALADMLTSLVGELGTDGLVGTGFDGDDLDDLLAMVAGPPDLDSLASDGVGDVVDDDANVTVRLDLPPEVAERWKAHRQMFDSDSDAVLDLLAR